MAWLYGIGKAMTALGRDISATKREDEERQREEDRVAERRDELGAMGTARMGMRTGALEPGTPAYDAAVSAISRGGGDPVSAMAPPDPFSEPIRTKAGWGQVGPKGRLRMIEGADLPTSGGTPVNYQRMTPISGQPRLAFDPRTATTSVIKDPEGKPIVVPEKTFGPSYTQAMDQLREYYGIPDENDPRVFRGYRIPEADFARLAPLMMKGEWFPGDPPPLSDATRGPSRMPGGSRTPGPLTVGSPNLPEPTPRVLARDPRSPADITEQVDRAFSTEVGSQQEWDAAVQALEARGLSRDDAERRMLRPRPVR